MGNFNRTQVGNVELIGLQDTWALMPPDEFFVDLPSDAWERYPSEVSDGGRLLLNMGTWLIASEGKTILVDTGVGPRPVDFPIQSEPAMPAVMAEAGVSPEDVDVVVFTHLHFDHTGWNAVERDGVATPLFPNARHVVQQVEWDFWMKTEKRKTAANYPHVLEPVEAAGLFDFVEGEHVVTSEVVTLPTPGHTPGHVSFVVGSGDERAYVIGDAAHQPVQVAEPSWYIGADVHPQTAIASREMLWGRIEREGALIVSGHFPYPGLGHAVTEDGRRSFRPLA
jgi:glyoxylase-like metal-dependent hydrolase (beta-lactamase superfamily II)